MEVIIDQEYCQKMLKFQRKVNPKEGLIGMYITGTNIEQAQIVLYTFYQKLNNEKKNKALLKSPLLLLIDPTMQDNKLSIRVSQNTLNLIFRFSPSSPPAQRFTS